jgi:hypothetical protein
MGRAPCCDKASVKKGPWSPEEDAKLKAYIEEHGTGGNWIALPQKIVGMSMQRKMMKMRLIDPFVMKFVRCPLLFGSSFFLVFPCATAYIYACVD